MNITKITLEFSLEKIESKSKELMKKEIIQSIFRGRCFAEVPRERTQQSAHRSLD